MKRITIKDIAKYLSVSVSTVSRALLDDKNTRRETKEKVLKAAKELGYKPNPVATNLRYGRTNTIGVIVPEILTPFASTVVNGIQDILYPQGFKVMLVESNESAQQEKENLRLMERFMVDGIIVSVCNYKENREDYLRLQTMGLPVVFYDRIPHGIDAPQVIVDDYRKSFFMVEHLIRKGYKRIVHLRGPDCVYNSLKRYEGYRDALSKFRISLDSNLVLKSNLHFDDGEKMAEWLITENIHFDALFAFTDTLAIGAMNRLRELGRRIPQDVAIAGFSGSILSSIVYPKLTTVEPPLLEMGKTAAKLVLGKIKDPTSANKTIVLDALLKIRESTSNL